VDRIEDNRAEHGTFAESVIEELVDVLEGLGVTEVDGGPIFDPHKHVVVTVAGGDGPQLQIIETVRRGWEARGAVLRPASVVVQKRQPALDGDAGSETG
jgi:molecular chaperone GrpE (heat shock protein)